MEKINNLRNKRVLNRYFFFQQELDLKEEMLEEMDTDFRAGVENYLKDNPELEALYKARIKQKQDAAYEQFKQQFKEETGQEISDSTEIEVSNKSDEEPQQEETNWQEGSEDEEFEAKPENEQTKLAKKLYREIVKLTHPDKIVDEQRNKLYMKATEAHENGRYLTLVLIANQLGITWEWVPNMESMIKSTVDTLQNRLSLIEKSVSWVWYNTDDHEVKKQFIHAFLLKNLE